MSIDPNRNPGEVQGDETVTVHESSRGAPEPRIEREELVEQGAAMERRETVGRVVITVGS